MGGVRSVQVSGHSGDLVPPHVDDVGLPFRILLSC